MNFLTSILATSIGLFVTLLPSSLTQGAVTRLLSFTVFLSQTMCGILVRLYRSQLVRYGIFYVLDALRHFGKTGLSLTAKTLKLFAWPLLWLIGEPIYLLRQLLQRWSTSNANEGKTQDDSFAVSALDTVTHKCAGYKSGGMRCGRKTPLAHRGTEWYCHDHREQATAMAFGVALDGPRE